MNAITSFTGENAFLSNFYYCTVVRGYRIFVTAEHGFQAAKTLDPVEIQQIQFAGSPGQAKRLGRKVMLREDWEEIKYQVMEELIHDKFMRHPGLWRALFKTEDAELVEGNHWHDNVWGSCDCSKCGNQGQNLLGKILMAERAELQE